MIVIDTETSGIDPAGACILSIGAVELEHPENRFYGECRVFGDAHVSSEALAINGFTDASARDPKKQSDGDLMKAFIAWSESCADRTLSGQNPSFDEAFMKASCARHHIQYPFAKRNVDLHSVAYAYLRGKGQPVPMKHGHSDQDLSKTLALVGITDERNTHNALEDALLEAEAFSRLVFRKKLLPEYGHLEIPRG